MNRFLKLSGEEKREVFQAISFSMGLRPDIVEKDFWVCFMLHHLFHDCKYKDAFVFKGGTSLSKAYHVIERFSEDIDIILDWRKIVPTDDNPWNDRSKTRTHPPVPVSQGSGRAPVLTSSQRWVSTCS